MVVPQTSTSADTGWTGLAKYTWSGYVVYGSLTALKYSIVLTSSAVLLYDRKSVV